MKRLMSSHPTRPARALLHPLWWVALGVLVLNDHLLKGSDLLPGALTGKLSDVAGLLVAPTILATALVLRSRRMVAAAHLAVGAAFAAINLSPAAAHALETLTSMTPWPWHVVVDPSDLLALPMIAVSWWSFVATPIRATPARAASARWFQRVAFGLGALACAASSPPDMPPRSYDWHDAFAVANLTSEPLTVRIQPLKETIIVDCDAAAADPSAAFTRGMFDLARVWVVEPDRTVPVRQTEYGAQVEEAACYAFLISGGGVPETLVFWRDEDYVTATTSSNALAESEPWRQLQIDEGPAGPTWQPHDALYGPLRPVEHAQESACRPLRVQNAVDWTPQIPSGVWSLAALTSSPDGCHRLDLRGPAAASRFYVCVPGTTLPFAVGDELTLTALGAGAAGAALEGVELRSGEKVLRVARGGDVVPLYSSGSSLDGGETEALVDCGLVHDACGGLVEPLSVGIRDGEGSIVARVRSGDSVALSELEAESRGTLTILTAMRLAIEDSACFPAAESWETYIESVYVADASPASDDIPEETAEEGQE